MKDVPSVEEFFHTILNRWAILLPLPGTDDAQIDKAWERAKRIRSYLLDRSERMEGDCMQCGKKKALYSQIRYAYDTPWDEQPVIRLFCSDDCGDSYMYEEPWAYFMCNRCDREILDKNPQDSDQMQYRNQNGELICLKCCESLEEPGG